MNFEIWFSFINRGYLVGELQDIFGSRLVPQVKTVKLRDCYGVPQVGSSSQHDCHVMDGTESEIVLLGVPRELVDKCEVGQIFCPPDHKDET